MSPRDSKLKPSLSAYPLKTTRPSCSRTRGHAGFDPGRGRIRGSFGLTLATKNLGAAPRELKRVTYGVGASPVVEKASELRNGTSAPSRAATSAISG